MPPIRWTDSEQAQWLQSHMDQYMRKQKEHKLHLFWPVLYEEYFRRFPEHLALGFPHPNDPTAARDLTPEERERLDFAVERRKMQLDNWFHNSRKKTDSVVDVTSAKTMGIILRLLQLQGKGKRAHRPVEVFQLRNRDTVKAALTAAGYDGLLAQNIEDDEDDWTDESEDSPAARLKTKKSRLMRLRTRVIAALWAEASDEERSAVEEAVEEEKRLLEDENSEAAITDVWARLEGIDSLETAVVHIHKALYAATKWVGFTILGGPHPRLKGQLSLKVICYGKTPMGNDFEDVCVDFDDNVIKPFQDYLRLVFSAASPTSTPAQASTDPAADAPTSESTVQRIYPSTEPIPAPAPSKAKKTKKSKKSPPKSPTATASLSPPPVPGVMSSTATPTPSADMSSASSPPVSAFAAAARPSPAFPAHSWTSSMGDVFAGTPADHFRRSSLFSAFSKRPTPPALPNALTGASTTRPVPRALFGASGSAAKGPTLAASVALASIAAYAGPKTTSPTPTAIPSTSTPTGAAIAPGPTASPATPAPAASQISPATQAPPPSTSPIAAAPHAASATRPASRPATRPASRPTIANPAPSKKPSVARTAAEKEEAAKHAGEVAKKVAEVEKKGRGRPRKVPPLDDITNEVVSSIVLPSAEAEASGEGRRTTICHPVSGPTNRDRARALGKAEKAEEKRKKAAAAAAQRAEEKRRGFTERVVNGGTVVTMIGKSSSGESSGAVASGRGEFGTSSRGRTLKRATYQDGSKIPDKPVVKNVRQAAPAASKAKRKAADSGGNGGSKR
ncbi:hypothetical protein R3P38DRAFT_2552643 [Favolaschia claudopus]|uniref:Uncharacterized protein n=1 Tax=Favolaschia claudopus TaxID=2862362 RepID=A0AAW0AFJ2_9AGAR